MFTIFTGAYPLGQNVDLSEYPLCHPDTYSRWIAAVHDHKTPVAVGDSYLWLEISLVPPRIYNCIIIVQEGDEYPPEVPV